MSKQRHEALPARNRQPFERYYARFRNKNNRGQTTFNLTSKVAPVVLGPPAGPGLGITVVCPLLPELNPSAAKLFATRGVHLGVYFGFFGNQNQVVRIEPPLIINAADVDCILDICGQVSAEFALDTVPGIAYQNTMIYEGGL
jgi:acetylornithine/succinyldiaminopimelate/putrescine aminotransferase